MVLGKNVMKAMGLDMGSIKQRYLAFAVISSVNVFRKSSSLVKVLGKNVMKAMGLDMRSIKQRYLTFCCNQICECVQDKAVSETTNR